MGEDPMETDGLQAPRLVLEERIHALLCGDLDDLERQCLLCILSHDSAALEIALDMLDLQYQARAAYGYDEAARRMQDSLVRLTDSLPDTV